MNLSLPCDTWPHHINSEGYGTLTMQDQYPYGVHQLIYTEWYGVISDRLDHVDHLCRNRACWEPAHLEYVPRRVNILRGVSNAAQNARKTHCSKGHEFTDENTYLARGRRYCRACQREWSTAWKVRVGYSHGKYLNRVDGGVKS